MGGEGVSVIEGKPGQTKEHLPGTLGLAEALGPV